MPIVILFFWAAVLAFTVFQLIVWKQNRLLAEGLDDDSFVVTTSVDPGLAATVTFFFGIAAPFFLYRSFGWRGALGGIALVFFMGICNTGSQLALAVLAGRA